MKEVIDTILRTEEDARQRIAEAREEAKRIAAEIEVEARRLVEAERDAAHARARRIVEEVVTQTKAERAARLEETMSRVGDLKGAKSDAVCRAVQKAYERVVQVERA